MKKNKFLFFPLLFTLSCSSVNKNTATLSTSAKNPYPKIFESVNAHDGNLELLARVEPSSLTLDCSLRNDSPYYWCYVEADLIKKNSKYPQKVGAVYHTVVDDKGVKVSKDIIDQFKKNKSKMVLVISFKASINDKDNMFSAQLMGMYNSKVCINLFDDYSNCPKKSKKIDVHTGDVL